MVSEDQKDQLAEAVSSCISDCQRQAKNPKFLDGWRNVFTVSAIHLTDLNGKLMLKDAAAINPANWSSALKECNEATAAANKASDDTSVKQASFELNQAIHALMVVTG